MSFKYSGYEIVLDAPKNKDEPKGMSFNEALKKCLDCKPHKQKANKKRSKKTFNEWLQAAKNNNL